MRTSPALGLGAVLLTLALVAAPGAQTRLMPIEEVRPGMVGTGRTVFSGSTLEDFSVEVLGVLKNVIAPNRNLILARLSGGPLAKTGVIAGMSGSPVYIDGRLVGAVSYALGQFATEPIAGITPIAEMTDAAMMSGAAPVTRPVSLSWPPDPQELFEIWGRDLARARPAGSSIGEALLPALGSRASALANGAMLRPIGIPLVAGGLEPGVIEPLAGAFSAAGFVPVAGQSPTTGSTGKTADRTLAPGDAVGVALLTGDFTLGATGTVTYVDGKRVYAFGHPMYNLGPTEFPMTTADVQVVLPSLLQSSKLASFGEVVGTLQQDRATAVAGTLGPGPSLIPMSVTLNSDRLGTRTFSFGVVRDTTFTPLLAYLAVANVLTGYERATGPASFTIRGTADIREAGALAFESIFTGDQSVGPAAAYIAGPLTQLLKNSSETVEVQRISLTIDASEEARVARIERVWLDTTRPRAGGTAMVSIALRGLEGEEIVKQVPVTFPINATGSVQLLVADGARATAEDRRAIGGAQFMPPSQIVRVFNRARRNNRLYVRLSTTEPGAVVSGEPMGGLPPSVLGVLDSNRNTGNVSTMRSNLRGEWEVPLGLSVSGSRQLTLTLDQPE